jgi:hypothetical protein
MTDISPEMLQAALSELGRRRAALRRRVDRPCSVCGRLMEQVTTTRKACSPACRQKAYERRRANRLPGNESEKGPRR